ncbi:MAG: type 1 glutamine amidotransferase [archaeon]
MKKVKIAIIELYPNRGEFSEKLLRKTRYSNDLDVTIFPVHKDKKIPKDFDGVILTGGVITVSEEEKYPYLKKVKEFLLESSKGNLPILGLCLGHQMIADAFGGKVEGLDKTEVGFRKMRANKQNPLLKGIPNEFYCFNYHGEYVSEIPQDFENFASSKECKVHLIQHKTKPIFGIQFHPEYDRETARKIINFEKEDLEKEGFDIESLLQETTLYSEDVSIKIFENFIKIISKEKNKK